MEDIKTNVDVAEAIKSEEEQTDVTTQKDDKGAEKQGSAPFEFDYEKLAQIVNGKQSVAEDTVVKNYFKQQGLSPDEMTEAINSYKSQKKERTPDVESIQTQASDALSRALKSEAQYQAVLMAPELGVDVQAVPFLVKALGVETVIANGEVNKEALKSGLEEIISAMPQLKQTQEKKGGFQKVGADPNQNAQSADDAELERAFGVKN